MVVTLDPVLVAVRHQDAGPFQVKDSLTRMYHRKIAVSHHTMATGRGHPGELGTAIQVSMKISCMDEVVEGGICRQRAERPKLPVGIADDQNPHRSFTPTSFMLLYP